MARRCHPLVRHGQDVEGRAAAHPAARAARPEAELQVVELAARLAEQEEVLGKVPEVLHVDAGERRLGSARGEIHDAGAEGLWG